MLKWTASAQRLAMESPSVVSRTPRRSDLVQRERRARRATIANKENIPYATSTPMVRAVRNSPLTDILNITPEASTPTPERHRRITPIIPVAENITKPAKTSSFSNRNRRHSTIGITLPSAVPYYARTLPRFQVEEYSPSGPSPTGQQLALRGLIPDPFLSNARYFQTPDLAKQCVNGSPLMNKSLPKKRKLNLEFAEESETPMKEVKPLTTDMTAISSAKMGDETLDKLIDAILDSARKDVKKKKPRKSFNLRRRTLLKSHAEAVEDVALSPSYAAGDDPASDLSFPLINPHSDSTLKCFKSATTLATPTPATPPPGTPLPQALLCQLPTPTNVSTTTFKLETPVRTHARKRRTRHHQDANGSESANRSKKFKVDSRNYFEIGVALPSIYV